MDEIERMEAALRAAIAAHRIALQQRVEAETQGFEQRFLFARLGVVAEELDAIAAAPNAAALPPALRDRLRQRLASEATRLVRLARAQSPSYDINRHIAVRRAVAWIERRVTPVLPTSPGVRRSGWVLNGRFRGSKRRTAVTAQPDAGDRRPPP